MPILAKTTKRVGYRLVGAQLPLRVHSYISLYTLAKDIGKSDIFIDLLSNWVSEQKEKDSDEVLIREVIKKIQDLWERYQIKKPKSTILIFKSEVREELVKRGIVPNYIDKILEEVE